MTDRPVPPRSASRGRPSREEAAALRARLCDAALREFLRNGYSATSIEGVARASGVSRTTIYALYRDKATLFGAMLRESVSHTDIGAWVAFDDRPPELVLTDAIRAIRHFYYRKPNLKLMRLCISEAERFPELTERLRDVLGDSLVALTAYFVRLRDAGRLRIDDCEVATRLFNLLALGTLSPFFIPEDRLTDYQKSGHLEMALQIFLNGALRTPPECQSGTPA